MLFSGSRYQTVPIVETDGIRSLAMRRIVPQPRIVEHVVMEGERLDQLAARFFGDPAKTWLILDANLDEVHPLALLQPGRRISIPLDRVVAT